MCALLLWCSYQLRNHDEVVAQALGPFFGSRSLWSFRVGHNRLDIVGDSLVRSADLKQMLSRDTFQLDRTLRLCGRWTQSWFQRQRDCLRSQVKEASGTALAGANAAKDLSWCFNSLKLRSFTSELYKRTETRSKTKKKETFWRKITETTANPG